MSAASAATIASQVISKKARKHRRHGHRNKVTTYANPGNSAASTIDPWLRTRIEEMIALQPVMVFSKSWCPFCAQAKDALGGLGKQFAKLELDTLGPQTEAQVQDVLAEITGARTVPRVFIGGTCIGGGTDTMLLAESGQLSDMVDEAQEAYKEKLQGKGEFAMQKSDDEWSKDSDAQRFQILRRRGTEPPGSHPYDKMMPEKGHFSCGACGLPLYSAQSKFESNCGWPVFDKVYASPDVGQHVGSRPDGSGSLEIVCNRCGSHLGHVFYDAVTEANPNGERH